MEAHRKTDLSSPWRLLYKTKIARWTSWRLRAYSGQRKCLQCPYFSANHDKRAATEQPHGAATAPANVVLEDSCEPPSARILSSARCRRGWETDSSQAAHPGHPSLFAITNNRGGAYIYMMATNGTDSYARQP